MNESARDLREALGLRSLRAFAEIIRTGSATAAGRNLGMAQPAVSRLLGQLERKVGFELFYRDRGRLVPTKDGLLLANEVELALAGFDRVEALAQDIASSATGELRIVAPPSFTEGPLPGIVSAFLARHPGVRVKLDSRSVETSKTMIATRVADCGFMKLPIDDPQLATRTLTATQSVCVLSMDHPLAAHDVLTPPMLHGVPLILLGAGRPWRGQVDLAFAGYGMRPTVALETHTHGSACALAAQGLGVAIVNELLAASYIRPPLRVCRFEPVIVQEYAFVVSALSAQSRVTEAFGEVAAELLGSAPAV